jgi:hypothetical protein
MINAAVKGMLPRPTAAISGVPSYFAWYWTVEQAARSTASEATEKLWANRRLVLPSRSIVILPVQDDIETGHGHGEDLMVMDDRKTGRSVGQKAGKIKKSRSFI